MTVWTLTNSWIEGESSDTILMGIYVTKELAQKAMQEDFNGIIHNDTFKLEELTASATVGGRHYTWEIEEREVQGYNTDVIYPSYCYTTTTSNGDTVVTILGDNTS